jgi:alpha-beta hydrolase superfamily lysophospholipase
MKRTFLVLIGAVALLLGACATPLVQQAGMPDAAFQGPQMKGDAFVSFDGTRLPLERWDAPGEPWAVMVGLHGMNDYAHGFYMAAPRWAAQGIEVYAFDQRGYGRTPHRGIWGGSALMDEDLRALTALARARYPHAVIAVAGISIGGALAIETFASDRPPDADRLVLLAPAVWGWSSQPAPRKVLLWVAAHSMFRGTVLQFSKSWSRNHRASDNLPELRRMARDPLVIQGARPDALYGAMNAMQRGWWSVGLISTPTFFAYGAKDQIVPKRPSVQAASRLRYDFRSAYYPEGHHLLLVDRHRDQVIEDVAAFIRDPAGPLPSGAQPIPKPLRSGAPPVPETPDPPPSAPAP